jgi:hypothetical protein
VLAATPFLPLVAPRSASAHGTRHANHAFEASTVSVSDRAELHLVSASGNTLIEEGRTTGTLLGAARVSLTLELERGSAKSEFTLYVRGGSLRGEAHGKASSGGGGWESFGGTMSFAGGSGRYAHAAGSGKLYGAIDRASEDDRLQVQVIARLILR